jgi:hypothetical protein
VWKQQALSAFLERQLWIACIVTEIALCIALIKRDLLGRYPCLFGLALVNAIRDIALSAMFGSSSPMYARAWVATLPILMSVQIATVLEAYTKLTSQYPGLGDFGSKLLRWCLVLLVTATCISVSLEAVDFTQSIIQAVLFTYRYMAFVLAGCLALPWLVLSRFPKPNQRPAKNIRVHFSLLVLYFCVYILSFLCANVLGTKEQQTRVINVVMLSVLCVIYVSWTLLLRPAGEAAVPWPKLSADLAALIDAHSDAAFDPGKGARLILKGRDRSA